MASRIARLAAPAARGEFVGGEIRIDDIAEEIADDGRFCVHVRKSCEMETKTRFYRKARRGESRAQIDAGRGELGNEIRMQRHTRSRLTAASRQPRPGHWKCSVSRQF